MENSSLINILNSFSGSEWKNFERFVRSPYFNTSKPLIKFVSAIKKAIISKNESRLEKKVLYKIVYPGRAYSDALIRKLISLTRKHCYDFLAVSSTLNNKAEINRKVLFELSDRNVTDSYGKIIKEANNWLKGQFMTNDLFCEKFNLDYIDSLLSQYEDMPNKNLHSSQIKSLINYFAFAYVKIYIINTIREQTSGINLKYPLWNELEKLYSDGNFLEQKEISIFFELGKLFKLSDEEAEILIKKIDLYEFERFLSKDDRSMAYYLITQFLAGKMLTQNIPDYEALNWKYYKKLIELKENTNFVLHKTLFSSIVTRGLAMKDIEWVKYFVKNFKKNISRNNLHTKEVLLSIAEARILTAEGFFKESLNVLGKINPRENYLKADLKALKIINLFELEMIEDVMLLINTSNKYLSKRNEYVTPNRYHSMKKFLNVVDLIIRYRFSKKKLYREKTELNLEKIFKDKFIFRNWALEKFEIIKTENKRS